MGFTLLNLILKSPALRRSKVLLIEQAAKPADFRQPPRFREDISPDGNGGAASDYQQQDPGHGVEPPQTHFSNRVSSITHKSRLALRKTGVWDSIKKYTKEVKGIKVWNYDYAHRIVFHPNQMEDCRDEDRHSVFSVVENNRLSLALLNNLGVKNDLILWNHALCRLRRSDSGLLEIAMTDKQTGDEIIADTALVLGCDGFKSKVRELSGMAYSEIDLRKTAIVGTFRVDMSTIGCSVDNSVAYQKFSAEKDTVIALLPLDPHHSSFVISAPHDYAKELMAHDQETFSSEVNRLLASVESPRNCLLRSLHSIANSGDDYLRKSVLATLFPANNSTLEKESAIEEPPRVESLIDGSRACYPLVFGTTTPKMRGKLAGSQYSQVALLGDSSHRVHPLAGQGLNLGIQDAIELVEQLESKLKCGQRLFSEHDITSLDSALRGYECKRQTYIVPMSAAILSMPQIFKLMPSHMISSLNRCEPIKNMSVRFANGYQCLN